MDALRSAGKWNMDLPAILNILARSNEVRDADGLLSLINEEVAALLGHESMICGYHVISAEGSYVQCLVRHNYPSGYIEAVAASELSDSPLMQRWRATREPVLFQGGRDDDAYPAEWVGILKKFELSNIIGHGVLDVRGSFGSYFVFARLPGEVGEREIYFLKMIIPHLHLALMRAVAASQDLTVHEESSRNLVSERQHEILRWINQGKTNKQVAIGLDITEKNVKYHVEQIFAKLQVRSRAQAISKAILLGLLK